MRTVSSKKVKIKTTSLRRLKRRFIKPKASSSRTTRKMSFSAPTKKMFGVTAAKGFRYNK
jgi:hypothetical protein